MSVAETPAPNLPLYVGVASVAYMVWRRSRRDTDEETLPKHWVMLALLGVIAYGYKERAGDVIRHVGPLLASYAALHNHMGYAAAGIAAVLVYLATNPGEVAAS